MATPGKSSRKPPSRGHALVVEDEVLLAAMIEDTLLDAGYERVTVSTTTNAALAILREDLPDIVILDVHLADRDDGWAIAELLDEVSPNRPDIVFSTGSPEEIPSQIAGLGTILAKPYTPQDLLDVLEKPEKPGLLGKLRGKVS